MSPISREPSASPAARRTAIDEPLTWLLAGIALAKLTLLAVVGPSFAPDTGVYVAFADGILNGAALAPLPWGADATPPLVFRTAGYPLILAAAKWAAPTFWASLTVMVQDALAIAAMALLFRVAERLFASPGWAALATLLYAGSQSLLWDNSLLSDSLYGSLFNIVVFALLGDLLGCWRLSPVKTAGLATLWGYSLWTRDDGLYFTYLPLLLLLARAWGSGNRRRLASVLGFTAIVAAFVGAYVLFNRYRTGEAFFSLTGEENFLRPLFDIRRYGYADPFTSDDAISQMVRETMTEYDFPAQLRFIAALHLRCRCTPTELQSLFLAKFIAGVAQHPLAYLRFVVRNLDYFDLASDLADPIGTINEFVQLGTAAGQRLIIAGITKTISAVLFTTFVIAVPLLWLREWWRAAMASATQAAAFLWFAFVSVIFAFSLVHLEPRHAVPLFPAADIGMVYVLWRIAPGRRRRA
jgi:hypothetical protein